MQAHRTKIHKNLVLLGLLLALPWACQPAPAPRPSAAISHGRAVLWAGQTGEETAELVLRDFESADLGISWTPAAESTTRPAALSRSSQSVEHGLWCMQAQVPSAGTVVHKLPQPMDARKYDSFSVELLGHSDLLIACFVEDAQGRRVVGDYYPVGRRWQRIGLDLATAGREGVDISQVATVGLAVRGPGTPAFQTDQWALRSRKRVYVGKPDGPAKMFHVERSGGRLSIGQVGLWELVFHQRATPPGDMKDPGPVRPWLEFRRGANGQIVVGASGTGLRILNQDQYDQLAKASQRGVVSAETVAESRRQRGTAPVRTWPTEGSMVYRWQVAWVSEAAALVEVRQTCGPFDRLGRPAAVLDWKFTVYQTGQVFAHLEWKLEEDAKIGEPVSLVLALDSSAVQYTTQDLSRVLPALYPENYQAVTMPHEMQIGNPVAMLAKTGSREKDLWWWAEAGNRRFFGVGLTRTMRQGPIDLMLLANDPTPLTQASAFSAFLVPPTLKLRAGVLDRDFPGDRDNDGLVEPYGFQVVRLTNGRAVFTVDPENRPLYYPAFLFTVPAADRDAVDLKNSHLLINIDGKQFADPPQWPDGSFLLQLPYILNRPVQVEAVLTKKHS